MRIEENFELLKINLTLSVHFKETYHIPGGLLSIGGCTDGSNSNLCHLFLENLINLENFAKNF